MSDAAHKHCVPNRECSSLSSSVHEDTGQTYPVLLYLLCTPALKRPRRLLMEKGRWARCWQTQNSSWEGACYEVSNFSSPSSVVCTSIPLGSSCKKPGTTLCWQEVSRVPYVSTRWRWVPDSWGWLHLLKVRKCLLVNNETSKWDDCALNVDEKNKMY